MDEAYSSRTFEEKYTYQGNDLGAFCSPEKTAFRLWAPTAQAVTLNLYRTGTAGTDDCFLSKPMTADIQGTWVTEIPENLDGVYYTYTVKNEFGTPEVCDPYARTCGVNGKRAMVLDLSRTDPDGWGADRNPNGSLSATDCVIYELHIRDFSMGGDSGIHHKGKFLGLTETGTKTRSGSATGLDYLKSLGITHLHLLPIYDFGSVDEADTTGKQYNWGYDPVNYNVPEGSYATDPFHGEVRVAELKQMIKTLHDNGISVVMDVVYNHVFDRSGFCFNQIVPGYFSRIDDCGIYSNGSGCGNDTASERSMVRKYIVDSIRYWATEYHIDGFRFDLVGLLDIETVNALISAVPENTLFYGEGWDLPTMVTKPGTALAVQKNAYRTPRFAYFNDSMRDNLRGSVFYMDVPGFAAGATGKKDALTACFLGAPGWAMHPAQSVNYISCHDNHTLADRIAISMPHISREDLVKRNNLAAAFSILSQGIPFFQAGEELLRSKPNHSGGFCHNTYCSSDRVNSIKWSHLSDKLTQSTLQYYQGLLAIRKQYPLFRLATAEEVKAHVVCVPVSNPLLLSFFLHDTQTRIFTIFNAGTEAASITLPDGLWKILICDQRISPDGIGECQKETVVPGISTMVLIQAK